MPSVSHRPILQMRLGQFQADGLSIASVSQGRSNAAVIWAFPVRKAVYHRIAQDRAGNAPGTQEMGSMSILSRWKNEDQII